MSYTRALRQHLRDLTSSRLRETQSAVNLGSSGKCSQTSLSSCSSMVSIEDFEILSVLGKGAYGKVFQVRKQTGCDMDRVYAMKSVTKSRISKSKTDVRHTRTERDVLASVQHPFIIKMYYAFETRNRIYFVQEFCRGGELFRLMETERMFLEEHARFYLCEIACALEYLHDLDIVYRDLKTENIMLDCEGHIKLIDFGLSKMFDDPDQLTTTFCGTVEYMAPEVVVKSPGHGKPADWWSFGIFMFDLLTGRSPFHSNKGKKETKERILRGKFTIPHFITQEASDLLRRLLRRNVERRLNTAALVKSHIFFRGINWDLVQQKAYKPPHVPTVSPKDDADISQFDPRFTSRSPKESDSCDSAQKGEQYDHFDELFGDFDYVSPELVHEFLDLDDDDDQGIQLGMHDLHIRGHGE